MKSRWSDLLSSQGLRFFVGTSIALIVVQLATVWTTVCGVSAESLTALFMAGTIASLAYSFVLRSRLPTSVFTAFVSAGVLLNCCVAMPNGFDAGLNLGVSLFYEQPWLCFGVPALLAATVVLALQCWVKTLVGEEDGILDAAVVSGLTVGFLSPIVTSTQLFPVFGPVAVVVVLATIASAFTRRTASPVPASLPKPALRAMAWRSVVSTFGLAMFLHSATRFLSGLMPVTFALLLPTIAICVLCWKLMSQTRIEQWLRTYRVSVILLIFPVVIPLAFHLLVEWNLSLNATVDSVALLFAARSLQLAAIWFPGIAAWKTVNRSTAKANSANYGLVGVGCAGLATATILSSFSLGIPACMALSVLCVTSAMLVRQRISDDVADQTTAANSFWRPACASGCVAAMLIAVLPMEPSAATQLLFSSRASQGFRAGLDVGVIDQSTGFRLLSAEQSKQGYLTAWSTSGDQMQLRLDGIPLGQVSANTQTSPQPVPDSLPVLLPLVMHRNASSILLLGDETGVGLRVCSDFPVHTVVASRPNPATTAFAAEYTWRSMKISPLKDDRVRVTTEPAAITIRRPTAPNDRFDVVVAVSPNPLSVSSLEQLTPEFYAAARSQLTDQGVFCQRITRHDLGVMPLLRIVSSLSDVFGRVVLLQMAEGEIALVAGVQADSLLDKGLLTRMQRSHVGRALSRSGWDWSQVAALPVIDTNDPVGIFEHQQKPAAASSANTHFAFAIPLQAVAWNDKASELRSTMAPHQQRLADAADRGASYNEFALRFSAVVQQAEILANFPDQPWPYRRSLKMEMQRNPRPPIERSRNGKVERIADPRDNRRKNYFVSLGNVLQQAKNGAVDPLALRELTTFTAQYEPLLSYFAHHELVRIHEAAGHPSPAIELRHRLHTVYFSSGNDFSVRLVTNAMQQILDDPELVTDDATRFDYMNSMLQELVRRWEMRRNYDPSSARQTQLEVETCVAVSRRALDAMQKWSNAVGITHEQMLARRKFINKGLISPLRTYNTQVLAHRMKNETPLTLDPTGEANDLPMLINPADALTN